MEIRHKLFDGGCLKRDFHKLQHIFGSQRSQVSAGLRRRGWDTFTQQQLLLPSVGHRRNCARVHLCWLRAPHLYISNPAFVSVPVHIQNGVEAILDMATWILFYFRETFCSIWENSTNCVLSLSLSTNYKENRLKMLRNAECFPVWTPAERLTVASDSVDELPSPQWALGCCETSQHEAVQPLHSASLWKTNKVSIHLSKQQQQLQTKVCLPYDYSSYHTFKGGGRSRQKHSYN